MQTTIYRVAVRRQGKRTTTGQFAARHEQPRLIQIEHDDKAAPDRASLGDLIAGALAEGTVASGAIDRVSVELIGALA